MAQPTIQTSFASGEWAPKLRSRVDIQKYRAGAALMRNFYVDYSGGGASTRQGTKFIQQCKSPGARLIPFQPSSTLSYVLEFGQNYIRFYSNGASILENPYFAAGFLPNGILVLTGIPPWNVGDWVYAVGWTGLTNVNGRTFLVANVFGTEITVTDLNGNAITIGGGWSAGGTLSRVYTIPSPYLASDLFPNPLSGNPGLKFVQDVTSLIICHPSYPMQVLTEIAATDWTLTSAVFVPTIGTPTGITATTTSVPGAGWNYAYLVTAVDVNGQESGRSAPGNVTDVQLISSAGITNTLSWTAVPGAQSYNVYKASPTVITSITAGAPYGFIGNTTALSFNDAYPGITPDFAQSPPIIQNPFLGASVTMLAITAAGSYNNVAIPTATIAPPGAGGTQATAQVALTTPTLTLNSGGSGYHVGDVVALQGNVIINVATLSGSAVATFTVLNPGSLIFGEALTAPSPIAQVPGGSTSGGGLTLNANWGVGSLVIIDGGSGYTSTPAVTFSGAGGASATATVGTQSSGNPGVPGFIQERLMLAGQPQNIQGYNISQPSSFFNFNISNPLQDDDAISGTIIAEELNDIRNLTPVPTGMIAFTGKGAWLINGGGGISTQVPITPSNQTAQPQGFNGANDLKPIKINMDVLYVTNKGNYVRDLTYNLYMQIFTGTDISVFSNHLFFGFYTLDWCWSEEPFKTMWIIRSDGIMLSLGFVKEQDLMGFAHHDTNGQFKSVCSVIENVNGNIVDAVYVIVQRETIAATSQADNTWIVIPNPPPPWGGTWDPTTASNLILSNGNLTATQGPINGDLGTCASTNSYSSGQWYIEFSPGATFSTIYDTLLIPRGPFGGVHIDGTGGVYVTGSFSPGLKFTLGSIAGQNVGVAIDATNALIWVSLNGGYWNNDSLANPATNTGGLNFSTNGNPSGGPNTNGDTFIINADINTNSAAVTANFSSTTLYPTPYSGAPNITLSNANHTGTLTAFGTGEVQSATSYTSGTVYAEFAVSSDWTNPATELGIMNITYASVTALINASLGTIVYGFPGSPITYPTALGSFAGGILGIALNASNALIWFQVNGGLWNGSPSANPATGVGGINFPTTAGVTGPNLNGDAINFVATIVSLGSLPSITIDTLGPFTYINPFPNEGISLEYVERMADRYFPYGYEDAWSVDCALQTLPVYSGSSTVPAQNTALNDTTLSVSAASVMATFTFSQSLGLTSGNVGQVIRTGGGIATITSVASGSVCTCNITQAITSINPYSGIPISDTLDWTLWIPIATVSGLYQLANQVVVGVADGVPVGPFAVSATGSVDLGLTASKVTLGLAYLPQLQTLPLDLGEPTVQGKRKKITGITVRVADTLGLSIGKTFNTLVAMKDFTLGNVPTTSSGPAMVTGLVSGDGRTIIDQEWETAGSYCIQQNLPYPATILGAMPEVTIGDTK